MYRNLRGFTVVEVVVTIAVLAILATIVAMSYGSVQNNNMTTAGEATANQVALNARAYYSTSSVYPTLAQLQSTTIPEAKLNNTASVVAWVNGSGSGGFNNESTYNRGQRVTYRRCTNGGVVYYWDYNEARSVGIQFGRGC